MYVIQKDAFTVDIYLINLDRRDDYYPNLNFKLSEHITYFNKFYSNCFN